MKNIYNKSDTEKDGAPKTVVEGSEQTQSGDPDRIKRLLRSAESHCSLNKNPNKDTSLLLLMDQTTASASEIMIAALSCAKRAVTLGECTKGKNVAQALVQMSDGSGLAFTIREYLDPHGGYMGDGITPDIPAIGVADSGLVGRIIHRHGKWSLSGGGV